jgi:hypothetical protein
MLDTIMMGLGVLGAFIVLWAYHALETGRIKANNTRYYGANAISSLLLVISMVYRFDMADAGGVLTESCWLLISLRGAWRFRKAASEPEATQLVA